jgi:hypothetical protein
MFKLLCSGTLVLVCIAALGCGKGEGEGTHVSGKVMFKGQKVPSGMVYFDPDTSKGNKGTQGFARVDDGLFDTRMNGRGAPPGEVIIRIEGFTGGEPPTPLFAHKEQMTISEGDPITKDFDVPASAAKNVSKSTGPPP